jgi:hypothetical protein
MKPSTSVILTYELAVLVLALLAAAIEWYRSDWGGALFMFVCTFVLINIPLFLQVGVNLFRERRRNRAP